MVDRTRRAWFVACVCAALVAAACTGAPRPQTLSASGQLQQPRTSDAEATTDSSLLTDAAGNPVAGATDAAGNPVAGAAGAGAATAGAGAAGGARVPGAGGPASIPMANLYTPADDRIGISNSTITLCGHAALIFAQAFDIRPEDLNVYWQMVHDRPGRLHGRDVHVTYEDDQYDPARALQAAENCKAKNPFLLLGGIGFDQIPFVRAWADQNKMLYFHHIAVGAGGEDKRYSFTSQPTVEQVGTAFGQYIASKYGSKKVGIFYRASEYWEPGQKTGRAVLDARRVDVVGSVSGQRNDSVYAAQIRALQGAGAEVVWVWENALAAAEFIKQAQAQNWYPTFVVFPFQTTLDVLGTDGLRSKIDGVSTWSAYRPGGYPAPYNFPEHAYDAEIKRFDAAMAKYRPGVKPNDILWQVWLSYKGLDDLLTRCGKDCSRNRLAGMLLAGDKVTIAPNCPVDFSRGNGHRGGFNTFMTMEAYNAGGTPNYRTTKWCTESLG